ncbi:MAG TPA: hypothetical protein VFQ87_10620, partial [Bradyrhizobium sp.]|nr:hypothetical protein [Bradyrhizobium sp.]
VVEISQTRNHHGCETCGAKPVCHGWLVRQPVAVMFAPEFCPNAHILFKLEIDQPVTRHRQQPLRRRAARPNPAGSNRWSGRDDLSEEI